jgi:hypothetical protein
MVALGLTYVLRHDRKMNSKMLKAAAKEARIVTNLCLRFQEAGIHCPVLTTFESQPVTLRHKPNLLRSEKRIVVDQFRHPRDEVRGIAG